MNSNELWNWDESLFERKEFEAPQDLSAPLTRALTFTCLNWTRSHSKTNVYLSQLFDLAEHPEKSMPNSITSSKIRIYLLLRLWHKAEQARCLHYRGIISRYWKRPKNRFAWEIVFYFNNLLPIFTAGKPTLSRHHDSSATLEIFFELRPRCENWFSAHVDAERGAKFGRMRN